MKKVKKGDYGYIRYEKKKRLLTTVVLFLIPLAAFLAAFLITGTKKNIITVIAMVGCLPACRALVNMIMMWLQKPMDAKVYKKIQAHEGELEVTYETYLTTYEKSVFVESFAVCLLTLMLFLRETAGAFRRMRLPKRTADFTAEELQTTRVRLLLLSIV